MKLNKSRCDDKMDHLNTMIILLEESNKNVVKQKFNENNDHTDDNHNQSCERFR